MKRKTEVMKILKWVLLILLAVAFIFAGITKIITPYEELVSQMPWAEDFSSTTIMVIGVLEVLGALGLLLPKILKKYTFFIPISAIAFTLTMVGALVVHLNRGESIVPNLVLLVLSLVVARLTINQLEPRDK